MVKSGTSNNKQNINFNKDYVIKKTRINDVNIFLPLTLFSIFKTKLAVLVRQLRHNIKTSAYLHHFYNNMMFIKSRP